MIGIYAIWGVRTNDNHRLMRAKVAMAAIAIATISSIELIASAS